MYLKGFSGFCNYSCIMINWSYHLFISRLLWAFFFPPNSVFSPSAYNNSWKIYLDTDLVYCNRFANNLNVCPSFLLLVFSVLINTGHTLLTAAEFWQSYDIIYSDQLSSINLIFRYSANVKLPPAYFTPPFLGSSVH